MAPYKVGSVDVRTRDACKTSIPQLDPKTVKLPAGHRKQPNCRPLDADTIFQQDHALTLRDGTKIYADIFRPKSEAKVPAIMMWGPYGKTGKGVLNLHSMPLRAGIPETRLSGYEDFEGLDPAEWVSRGYAIVNVDARGVNNSEGDIRFWGTSEAQDGHDAIEEIAKLPWCSGKIAMAGNSWLGVCQYGIAGQQPPHLACIAPLEGLSDALREDIFRGGIPNTAFGNWITSVLPGRNQVEDLVAMGNETPHVSEYFADKRFDMKKIQVPAYIGASYSTAVHTIGSLRAFEEIPHNNKWLALHASQEWYDLYSPERTKDLAKFFEFYLKDVANDWPQTAPVRLALLKCTGPALVDQEFTDLPWHLPSATSHKLYLAPSGKLTTEKEAEHRELTYQADSSEEVAFTYQFPSKTVLAGPSTLAIDVASVDHDDMDIYTHIFKADSNGKILSHVNMPKPDETSAEEFEKMTQNRVWRYQGPNGKLRVSRRHVSPEMSGKTWKTLSHAKEEKVKPGEVVSLELQLWPTGIVFEAGEKLILKISGTEVGLPDLPNIPPPRNENKGKQVLHFGGSSEAHLQFFTL